MRREYAEDNKIGAGKHHRGLVRIPAVAKIAIQNSILNQGSKALDGHAEKHGSFYFTELLLRISANPDHNLIAL